MPLFARLYNFACWLTQDRTEAEDLVQETYVKALRGFGSYRPGTNFRAWIFRILRNSFLTSRTGLRATRMDSLDEQESDVQPTTSETPETLFVSQLESEAIQKALDQLPVHHREVILLCDMEEMGYQEIADLLAIPIGTVMSRLSRARRAMRKLLEGTLRV